MVAWILKWLAVATLMMTAPAVQPTPVALSIIAPPVLEQPTPAVTATPAPMPSFSVCAIDEAELGMDSTRVANILATDWHAAVDVDCELPDVRITVKDFGNRTYCGWAEDGGLVTLNSQCALGEHVFLGNVLAGEYVFRVALDHEIGHVFGLVHAEPPSVMYAMTVYLPTADDQALLAVIFTNHSPKG